VRGSLFFLFPLTRSIILPVPHSSTRSCLNFWEPNFRMRSPKRCFLSSHRLFDLVIPSRPVLAAKKFTSLADQSMRVPPHTPSSAGGSVPCFTAFSEFRGERRYVGLRSGCTQLVLFFPSHPSFFLSFSLSECTRNPVAAQSLRKDQVFFREPLFRLEGPRSF